MRFTAQFSKLAVLLLAATAGAGCGTQARDPLEASSTSGRRTVAGASSTTSTTTTGVTGGSGGSSGVITGNLPPYRFDVRGTGYDSYYYFKVRTRTVLKVVFAPGQQDASVSGSNYSPQYSALAVYIKVGDRDQPTALLYNGIGGHPAEQSTVMDYSTSFTSTCSSGQTSCRQDVYIYVQKPNYDHFCFTYGYACPHTHVQDSHPWNGTLQVQTDDTQAL